MSSIEDFPAGGGVGTGCTADAGVGVGFGASADGVFGAGVCEQAAARTAQRDNATERAGLFTGFSYSAHETRGPSAPREKRAGF
jgi:hypothetical protein